MQNQSNYEITFGAQLKPLYLMIFFLSTTFLPVLHKYVGFLETAYKPSEGTEGPNITKLVGYVVPDGTL